MALRKRRWLFLGERIEQIESAVSTLLSYSFKTKSGEGRGVSGGCVDWR